MDAAPDISSREKAMLEGLVRGAGLSSEELVIDVCRSLAIKQITLEKLSQMTMGQLKAIGVNQTMDQLKLLRAAKLSQATPRGSRMAGKVRVLAVKTRAFTEVVSLPEAQLPTRTAEKAAQQPWKAHNSMSYERSASSGALLGQQRSPRGQPEAESSSSEEEEQFQIVRNDTLSSAFPGVSLSRGRSVPSVKEVFRLKEEHPESPAQVDVQSSPTMRRLTKQRKRMSMSELASPLTAEFSRELMLDSTRAEHFKRFLESEHADENMSFYTSIEAYRSIENGDDRIMKAMEIVDLFFKEGGNLEVNLPHRLREPIMSTVEKAVADDVPPMRSLFDSCQDHVFTMLRQDSFSRFSRSVFYDMMVKGYQLRRITYNPAIFDTFVDLCDNTAKGVWEYALTKDGVETWILTEAPTESLVVKSRIRIRAPAADILAVVTEPKLKLAFDENMVVCDPVERFDDNFKVVHMVFKSPSIAVKDRDCIVGMLTRAKPEGCVCISRSVPSVNHPPMKGVIRIDVESSGYLIIPDPNEPGMSTVTYINQVNYRGRVPNRIAAKVAKSRMNTVLHLKEFMYEQEKEVLGLPNRMSSVME